MTGAQLEPQRTDIPHATLRTISAPFWDGVAAGRLRYQICTACGAVNAPPVELCRDCLGAELDWADSAGLATLYSWTVVHRPVTPAFTTPYAPAIVDLDEGFPLVTNLIGLAPEEIVPGMRLQVEFHHVHGDLHLPYFRPV